MASTVRSTPGRDPATGRPEEGADSAPERLSLRWRARPELAAAGLLVLLAVPLVVALVVLRHPRWYPLWDLATTEMQLRDVGTRHTPLTGVGGLLGLPDDVQGSHPGPLGLYLMGPFYGLFRSSAWAMQVAAAWANVVALGLSLWLVSRRRSPGLLVGTAAALALLVHAYGPQALTQGWAPYMPILWWFALLVATWCVLCGDLPVLPVAVFAGCYCVQNHAAYVLPAVGLVALAFGSVWWDAYRRRPDRNGLRRTGGWSLLALGVGVVLWIPPVLDQLTSRRGNLGTLWRHFRGWTDEPMGLVNAFELVLIYLDPRRLLARDMFVDTWVISGSRLPGALVLIAWVAAGVSAVRIGHRSLVRLHVVVAAGLVLAVVTVSRLGVAWWYRVQWLWGISVLVLMATGWTLAVLARRRLRAAGRRRAASRLVWAPLIVAVALTAAFAVNAAGVDYDRRDSAVLEGLVPQVVSALDEDYPSSARYLLIWDEATTGALGRGLMNELVRRGVDVGAPEWLQAEVRPHRVLSPSEATAVILLVDGSDPARWRAEPGVRQIARVEQRGSQQVAASDDRRGTVALVAPPTLFEG